ncbi:MAG TPA: hypothetical protein VFG01_10415, partial [Acidobacteriota bacterium]|nr:hypothetical protein [Acidobacteriota bacterium]
LREKADSSTLAISHLEGKKAVLDLALEARPPFDVDQVVKSFVKYLKAFKVFSVTQDRHAVAWIKNDLENKGIEVIVSKLNKSQIYEGFSVYMNKKQIEMLDNKRLRNQTLGLQRYLKSGGPKIDHWPGGHDDIINSAAGSLLLSLESMNEELGEAYFQGYDDPRDMVETEEDENNESLGEVIWPLDSYEETHFKTPTLKDYKSIPEQVQEYIKGKNEVDVSRICKKYMIRNDATPRKILKDLGWVGIGAGVFKKRTGERAGYPKIKKD